MLSLFPQLLFLTPAAIALLRIMLGIFLLYEAWFLFNERAAFSTISVWPVGKMPEWTAWLGACVYGIFGLLLIAGAWVQLVAILVAIGQLKGVIFAPRYPTIVPYPRSTFIALFCVSLALVAMGAGAFALDLPL